jgi:hypothetical protein
LLGIYDSPGLSRVRSKVAGRSLLRDSPVSAAVPLTNCSELWGCAFRNWGMMKGPLKLEAREWDFDWHCWDVVADPLERHDLGASACGPLVESANALFGGLPRNAAEGSGKLTQE